MLHTILQYAENTGLAAEPGFTSRRIKWGVYFDSRGEPLSVVELGDVQARKNPGRVFERCPYLKQQELISGKKPRSHFLVESAEVAVLFHKEGEEEKKIKKNYAKHVFFVRMLREAAEVYPPLCFIADALEDEKKITAITKKLAENNALPTDLLTVGICEPEPGLIVEDSSWHDWWREFRKRLSPHEGIGDKSLAPEMRCFLTGKLTRPCLTQTKVKGLAGAGGLPTGDVLSGFDKEAFCSYGLKQAANAAMSEEATVSCVETLNRLLRDNSYRLAGNIVVHWFRNKVTDRDDPIPFLENPVETVELDARERIREMLGAVKSGKRPDLQSNNYYALTLSGAAGRVMVRDWMEGAFENLLENISSWFDDTAITMRDGTAVTQPARFWAILAGTVRETDELTAPFIARMWRTAINREPIPLVALNGALARTRADILDKNSFNPVRMGLMRAYHVRKGDVQMKESLNEEHPSPAYHCGRIMAVLADIQRLAMPNVGAGLVQRFYAAASSTPALVLGRLCRNSQFHLSKLHPGRARQFENKISSIYNSINDSIPGTLDLEEQSLFALGYYHQMAAEKAMARKFAEEHGIGQNREEDTGNNG